jgi:hypothetical protein
MRSNWAAKGNEGPVRRTFHQQEEEQDVEKPSLLLAAADVHL